MKITKLKEIIRDAGKQRNRNNQQQKKLETITIPDNPKIESSV